MEPVCYRIDCVPVQFFASGRLRQLPASLPPSRKRAAPLLRREDRLLQVKREKVSDVPLNRLVDDDLRIFRLHQVVVVHLVGVQVHVVEVAGDVLAHHGREGIADDVDLPRVAVVADVVEPEFRRLRVLGDLELALRVVLDVIDVIVAKNVFQPDQR